MKREVRSIIYIKLLLLILVSSSVFLIAIFFSQPRNINITANAVSDFNNNLISYYTLDNNANDIIGINNGTISGATQNQNGVYNRSYQFDGVNDYIGVSSANSLNINKYTASVWVKTSSEQGRMTIVEFTKSSANGNNRRGIAISGNNNLGKPIETGTILLLFMTALILVCMLMELVLP
ncbi:hypothetical protein J4205_02900 [Candidatus Pacearchaeota archaeon]|nr:hypothetical protein [Candidatus Pacearchaeota archaeon]